MQACLLECTSTGSIVRKVLALADSSSYTDTTQRNEPATPSPRSKRVTFGEPDHKIATFRFAVMSEAPVARAAGASCLGARLVRLSRSLALSHSEMGGRTGRSTSAAAGNAALFRSSRIAVILVTTSAAPRLPGASLSKRLAKRTAASA